MERCCFVVGEVVVVVVVVELEVWVLGGGSEMVVVGSFILFDLFLIVVVVGWDGMSK